MIGLLKKEWMFVVIAILLVTTLLLGLRIKIKQAVDVEISLVPTNTDIHSLVGQTVTLLCQHAEWEVTDPPQYEFAILGIANEVGVFEPVKLNKQGEPSAIYGLYVYPKHFVGGAVKKDYAYENRFVFHGMLSNAPSTKNGSYYGDFELRLDYWEAVYPVRHWFLLDSFDENSKRHIFAFDYLLP